MSASVPYTEIICLRPWCATRGVLCTMATMLSETQLVR